jgi:large subunit ribosomal protein L15
MKLHELKPKSGSKFRKKEVGRGHGSGHGTYSTRGMKGQKARSGSSARPGFEGGQTPLLRRIPKLRGFKSIYEKPQILNLEDLQKNFKDSDKVTKKILEERKLIKSTKSRLKILGGGELTKKLTIEAEAFSKSAKEKIEKKGGTVKLIS